jgi:multiple sugar transport system ATP-binding protein
MAHIRLDKVTKRFGSHTALRDLTLDIPAGEFFVLLGPTGAGKTTTLRLIAGLDKPNSGTVSIGDEDVAEWSVAQRDVALVFQYYSLYPRYTVRQNLEFPLRSKVRNYSRAEIDQRIARAAKTLRIEHLLDRKTDRLSGGEMQRVAIGRAIVREPRAFLMDEPLSNLDAKLREALRAELKDLQMNLGATFLFVTHDQIEAMSMGNKIGVLNGGRISQIGTPYDIYNHPRDVFVAAFVGSPAMNLIGGDLRDGKATTLAGKLQFGLDNVPRGHDGPVTFGIRAEDVRVGAGEANEAIVHHIENHGVEKILTLRVGDERFKATVAATLPTTVDTPIRYSWNPARVHAFDAATGVSLNHLPTEQAAAA